MSKQKIKDPKAVFCIIFAVLACSAVIILFTIGGVFFANENPKVQNYANSICQVDKFSWKSYRCRTRYMTYTCYGPIWYVHYGENRTTPATVEAENRYRSYSDALEKASEYTVSHFL